ncbi:MAG TPA: serine/threonine-protein kinase [Ktedonobacteraceae bacterium]|nr:serine/threonine-protein kinase [Ktedonobacteraceae bacterium]
MDAKELLGVALGTCTLESVIGRGGMGAVYLAQQSRPVRTVAVKVLIPAFVQDPDQQRMFLARFQREADTIAKLEHKNILQIYEYDEAVVKGQNVAYLVMPFVRGGTLRERIEEMRRSGSYFDLQQVESYLSQTADALSYAHSMGVVHRDIKPANLLFHSDGRLLLSDFGIVRLQAMPGLTTAGSFLGTAEYASPEQISAGDVDFRSDIYSLGIILFELLTGTVPFTAPNPFAVMHLKMNEPVPSVRSRRQELSPAIDAVVMKALSRNPADRYQSATAFADDFRAALNANGNQGVLRIGGNANNNDRTFSSTKWGGGDPVAMSATVPVQPPVIGVAASAVPVTPGIGPNGMLPITQPGTPPESPVPLGWQLPSRNQGPQQAQQQRSTTGQQNNQDGTLAAPTYRQGRRLVFYTITLAALLLQFLVFVLLFAKTTNGSATVAMLGILSGEGINLLALAGIGFTSVTHNRNIRKHVYQVLAVIVLAPLVSGIFISFGNTNPTGSTHVPLLAYLLLLASNIYAIRQLALVDIGEQIETVPVLWRPAVVGALTGLLPLTIILIFALASPFTISPVVPPLLSLLGMLLVVLVATPTPGAVVTVWLSQKMSNASLVRSSAVAGALMFVGAFILAVLWGLIFSNHTQFLYNLSQSWIALVLLVGVLGLMGSLRGMLDAWVYQRLKGKETL